MGAETPTIPQAEFDTERLKILLGQSVATQSVGLLNYLIYYFYLRREIPLSSANAWIAACSAVFFLRIGMERTFRKKHGLAGQPFDPVRWENLFAALAFIAGSCWGVAGSFLLPASAIHQTFLAFLLAGTTAGAAIAYCTSLRTVEAFLLPSTIPFAIRLLQGDGEVRRAMALLLLLYIGLITILVVRTRRTFIDSIRLRFELKETQAKVAFSEKMTALGQMAAGIAHEVNNPLAILKGHNQLFRDSIGDEDWDRSKTMAYVEKSEQTINRIAKIVAGLRAFAKNERNAPPKTISVSALVEQTLDFCRSRFENHRISLLVSEAESGLRISCRATEISQVLLNLLNNAFDAVDGRPDAKVCLSVKRNGLYAVFTVTDNGTGVAEAIRDKIMEPFFTTKAPGKGTGLGLSIARNIVLSHGGTLSLDCSSPQTCFNVMLPLSDKGTREVST
jgi:signal transduction histidine kinase